MRDRERERDIERERDRETERQRERDKNGTITHLFGLQVFLGVLKFFVDQVPTFIETFRNNKKGLGFTVGGVCQSSGPISVRVHTHPLTQIDANIVHANGGGGWVCDFCHSSDWSQGGNEGR